MRPGVAFWSVWACVWPARCIIPGLAGLWTEHCATVGCAGNWDLSPGTSMGMVVACVAGASVPPRGARTERCAQEVVGALRSSEGPAPERGKVVRVQVDSPNCPQPPAPGSPCQVSVQGGDSDVARHVTPGSWATKAPLPPQGGGGGAPPASPLPRPASSGLLYFLPASSLPAALGGPAWIGPGGSLRKE